MVGVKKTISMVIVALAVASVVHADMMLVSPLEGGYWLSASICEDRVPEQLSDSNQPAAFLCTGDLGLSQTGFPLLLNPEAGQSSETGPALILTDRQNSLTLCLYALLGLGLCRSAPLVKKLHFGCIPDWYHSAGPFQIGHSFAISPDCRPSASVFCFLQPDLAVGTRCLLPRYRRETMVSFWRKSQGWLTVFASRGPPLHSC